MAIELNFLRNRLMIQSVNRPEELEVEPPKDDIPTPPPVVPEDKPVTASAQEVLALLAQGDVRFLAKPGGSSSLPPTEGDENDEGGVDDTTPDVTPVDPTPVPNPTPDVEQPTMYSVNSKELKFLPPAILEKYFTPVSDKEGKTVGYLLNLPYTEFEFKSGMMGVFADGSTLRTDAIVSFSYTDENGKKVTNSIGLHRESSLDSFCGGDWWRENGLAEEFFDIIEDKFSKNFYYTLKEGKSLEELKQKAPYGKGLGFETAEKARAAYVGRFGKMTDEIFDKYFEIVQLPNGRYDIATKEGFTFVDKQEKSYTYEQYGLMDDGTPVSKPITREYSVYTIRSEDGYDIQITFGEARSYPSVDILDANGNPIDDDGSIDPESIDATVIPGYADNGYAHAEEHSVKGRNAVQEMKDKAKELLNTPEFKNQLRAQYKAIIAAAGEVYDEIKFEYLYNRAVATTLLDESVIEVSGSGKKTRATFNVSILVWRFLDNADDFLRAGEHA